jgi:ketopantoate reductase
VHARRDADAAVADARGPQWRKVIFNASTNPIGALTGLTHGRVCERPDLRALVSRLVDEGKAVAAAQGIELDADPEELIDHAARPRSPTTTRRRCCRTSRRAGRRRSTT